MRLLIIFSFAFATASQAQLTVNLTTTKNNSYTYTSFNAIGRASLANKFKKGTLINKAAEVAAASTTETENFNLLDLPSLKKKAVELKYRNDELTKENERLKQKLATIHIAYLINQNELARHLPNNKKLQRELVLIDTIYDH